MVKICVVLVNTCHYRGINFCGYFIEFQLVVNDISGLEYNLPTILQDGPYTFVFFSSDRSEPLHVHVKRDEQIAKFWLEPVSLAKNRGFAPHEVRQVERLVVKHRAVLMEAWDEYFGA